MTRKKWDTQRSTDFQVVGRGKSKCGKRIAESSLIHIYCLVEDARSRNLGLINSVKRACAMFEFARKWKNDRRSLIKSISGGGEKTVRVGCRKNAEDG